jgi:hypothetical protein
MKPPKPRVVVEPDATFANVSWTEIPRTTYYKVQYSLFNSTQIINTLSVTSSSVILTALKPNTEYSINVNTVVLTQSSQVTVIHFKTLSADIHENIGSGESDFPITFERKYDLALRDYGYEFDQERPGLYLYDQLYQFCVFSLGVISNKSHIKIQLIGATGSWPISQTNRCHFDDTTIQIKIVGYTQWLDANRLRVPGILDKENGARVFDGTINGEWQSLRVTLSCICEQQYSGNMYVRIGLTNNGRGLSGVKLIS